MTNLDMVESEPFRGVKVLRTFRTGDVIPGRHLMLMEFLPAGKNQAAERAVVLAFLLMFGIAIAIHLIWSRPREPVTCGVASFGVMGRLGYRSRAKAMILCLNDRR